MHFGLLIILVYFMMSFKDGDGGSHPPAEKRRKLQQQENEYVVPKVWKADPDLGGTFGKVNRPTAGSRFEKELSVGKHSLQLYSTGTPNGEKVTMLLEELLQAGAPAHYDAWKINISGDQFGSGFVDINPNSKIPAMVDHSPDAAPIRIFESGSILLYLAEKYRMFLPTDLAQRTECVNWLFWQVGSAPYVGGGFGHFYRYAPTKMEYPINRYTMEVKRQLDMLDKHLADKKYMVGDEFTIADIAIFSWNGQMVLGRLYKGSAEFIDAEQYKNLLRWAKDIFAREGIQRGLKTDYAPMEENNTTSNGEK